MLTVIRKNGRRLCVCVVGVGWGHREVVVFEAGRVHRQSLISCLASSAPVGAHMLATGPRGCLLQRTLLSTVSWPPRHLINIKHSPWYLSVIIVVYLFYVPFGFYSHLSLFGKIRERDTGVDYFSRETRREYQIIDLIPGSRFQWALGFNKPNYPYIV